MSSRRKTINNEGRGAFTDIEKPLSLEEAGDEIYDPGNGNRASELSTGRVSVKPVEITKVRADIYQPRRAIPQSMRGDWDGNPEQVPGLLQVWHAKAESLIQQKINILKVLKGQGKPINYKDAEGKPLPLPPLAARFIALLQLGASIYRDKLINPITIAKRGDSYLIETGERRWLAHHLLSEFVSDKYSKIAATEVTHNVWRQSVENNNRENLNGVEKARQLSLLLMEMYQDVDGVEFYPMHHLVLPGESDLPFYQQPENGNVYKIKPEYQPRVQSALGVKSYRAVWEIRRILRLPKDIWMQADEEDWSPRAIRDYLDALKKSLEPENDKNTFPMGKVTDDNPDTSTWASVQWIQTWAYAAGKPVWVIAAVSADVVDVVEGDGNLIKPGAEPKQVNISALAPYVRVPVQTTTETVTPGNTLTPTPTTTYPVMLDRFNKPITVGAEVKTRTGHIGIVTGFNGRLVEVNVPDNEYVSGGHYPQSLVVQSGEAQTSSAPETTKSIADVPEELQGKNWSTSALVAKGVFYKGKPAFVHRNVDSEYIIILQDSEEIKVHKNLLVVNPAALKQKPTEVVTPKVEDETDDTDTISTPVSDVDPRLIVQSLADMASILKLPEYPILDDLAKLNRERLQAIINDGGNGLLEQLTEGYYKAAKDAVEKVRLYINAYIDEIVAAGLEITKED